MKVPTLPTSKEEWVSAITTDTPSGKSSQWVNADLAPTSKDTRTWTWISLSCYWWGNAFNASQWSNGASLIAIGLTWWQALIACMMANMISSSVALALGRPGACYHIGFPILSRSVFGMYGHYFFVWIRAVVAIIWYGVQTYFGSQLLSIMRRCVFGNSWWNMDNHLPEGAGISSKDLLAFFLFWMIELPLQMVHPTKIKHLFMVESLICPVACLGMFAWCLSYGGGLGVQDLGGARMHGSALGWGMLNGINSCLGVTSALLVNASASCPSLLTHFVSIHAHPFHQQPDLTRYIKRPKDAGWRQASSIFASKTLIFFFGIGATAAVQGKFGQAYWNQWDLLNAILDRFWGPAARAGCFFAAFGFTLSVVGVNIGCNSIPFGADVTGLFPRVFNIIRGQLFCGVVSLAIVPWKLLTSGSGFITFLGSYNIFIAPICGIIIVDYFLVKRGNIHTLSLFNPTPGSLYYGTKGWNLKALFAWVSAAVLGVPGLIGAYHPSWVSAGAKHLYQTGWVVCFTVAMCVYYVLCRVQPRQVHPTDSTLDSSMTFEQLAATEGYYDGEHRFAYEVSSLEGLTSHESNSLGIESMRETPKCHV